MRVLFTCAAEYGHLHPHLPLARALATADHQVAFALPEALSGRVADAGFPALAVGLDRSQLATEIDRVFPHWRSVAADDRFHFALTDIGARIAAPAALAPLVAAIREWKADLLVHGPAVFAGPLAATLCAIPSVNQSWGPLFPLTELRAAGEALQPLWEANGLPNPQLAGMFRHLYLDTCPSSLQQPEIAQVEVTQPMRPIPFDAAGVEHLPAWIEHLPDRPTVYVTMGTVFNRFTRLFGLILGGLAEQDLNVVVTVGYDQDPSDLGPQPDHVHVERYIPMSLLLPHCQLVITHGGAGSVLAALSHGIPLLLAPQGADQFQIAQRCVSSGAGRALAGDELQPARVREEAWAMLRDRSFREAADRIGHEISGMPGPEAVVSVLERLPTGGGQEGGPCHGNSRPI